MRVANTNEIRTLLGDLAFPASKQEIVEHANRGGLRTDSERALAALPLGDYDSLTEVLRSVPTDPDPGRTASERNYQRSHHKRQGLAEHMRESERTPIEDELYGERGEQF